MITNLAAWTPAEEAPPYVSFNYANGTVEITVRERMKNNGDFGTVSSVVLTQEEFSTLINDTLDNIGKLLFQFIAKETRTCITCRYRQRKEDEQPCSKCINSFADIKFDASHWEPVTANGKEGA